MTTDTTALLNQVAPRLRGLLGVTVVAADTSERARALTATPDADVAVCDTTPDAAADAVPAVIADHRAQYGRDPLAVVLPGVAVLGAADTLPGAQAVIAAVLDARTPTLTPTPATGRLAGRVALVTGAAQGFGLGISEELLADGATVILADLNVDLARREAERLASEHGAGRAVALAINVGDEQSCLDAVAEAVALFGGVDLFVSNAGVLRAEGVMTQPVADFDLVTSVNYRGYFLCVRAIAPIMAAQHEADPTRWFDIVEINSKSGLEGSKRNFAYAGSKFGGIGLTQSFALELVEFGIKVNAVCPGNFLDGPLWSDPERGLFVQYLRAGKVPGATTVAEVREFYEAKVPMRRGCTPRDVARAVIYAVEQAYETGQAIPVTGGQNMLN